jgi:hypothetical protein
MKPIQAMLLLLTFAGVACAMPTVSVQTDAKPREIYIGDPIAYQVTVAVSSDVLVAPFALPSPFGDFETLRTSSPTVTVDPASGKTTVRLQAFITTFSTGALTIPAIAIPIAVVGASTSSASSETINIHVRSLLAEKGDEGHLRPLKGLFTFRSYAWIWWLAGAVLVGVFGYLIWRKRTGRALVGSAKAGPQKPPEQTAWEALHALEDSDLLATGQHKEFYFQLSLILRQYLEERFGMSALDKTSSELLIEFRRVSLPSELTTLLRYFFDNADLVKFAKLVPAEPEIADDVNRVKQFVNATTVKKPEPPKKEEALPL